MPPPVIAAFGLLSEKLTGITCYIMFIYIAHIFTSLILIIIPYINNYILHPAIVQIKPQ